MRQLLTKRPVALFLAVCLCLLLFVGGHQLVLGLETIASLQSAAADAMLTHPAIIFLICCYVILLAVPFVPGAELGLILLLLFGADIAPIVYLATIAGMMLSFAIGRIIPTEQVAFVLDTVGLSELGRRVREQEVTNTTEGGPSMSWLARLLRHRYAALAVVINTPGNTILGGGGGLALAAGASRLYPPMAFLTTVLVAVSPVPIAVMFFLS